MDIVFHPIAHVHNHYPYPDKPKTWYGTESIIELDRHWVPALKGLTDFSHIVVVCYLHLISQDDPPMLIQSDAASTPVALDAASVHRRGGKPKGMMGVALKRRPVPRSFLEAGSFQEGAVMFGGIQRTWVSVS